MNIRTSTHQNGLSIIELMIALAISSLLILGITQIFIDNKKSYVFQRSQVNLQENARYAELLFNSYLAKAGYRRAPDDNPEFAFPAAPSNTDCQAFTAGSSITATTDKKGICIRYQPLVSGEPDCLGAATPTFTDTIPFTSPGNATLVTLAIKYIEGASPDRGTISCKNTAAGTFDAMLSNVADFRLDFGVGRDITSRHLVTTGDQFVSANTWAATTSGPIRAVRYSLLLASAPNQRTGASQVITNWLAGADAASKTRLQAADQNRLYQVAGSTRTLRSLMP